MRIFLLLVLLAPLILGCGNNKMELISERLELINGTIGNNNFHIVKSNELLYLKLNPQQQEKLKPIKSQTAHITYYTKSLKEELVNQSGGIDPETAMLVNTRDFNLPYKFIMNSKYKVTLKRTLNSSSKLISDMGIFEAHSVVLDAIDDPYWSHFPSTKRKTAIQLLFEGTNLPGALTTISQLENRILQYERKTYEIILLHELDSLRLLNKAKP